MNGLTNEHDYDNDYEHDYGRAAPLIVAACHRRSRGTEARDRSRGRSRARPFNPLNPLNLNADSEQHV